MKMNNNKSNTFEQESDFSETKINPTDDKSDNFNEDIFSDLDRIMIGLDIDGLGTKTPILNTIPVKKPNKQWFNRVHPTMMIAAALFIPHDKPDQPYFVVPGLIDALREEVVLNVLFVAITNFNHLFLWPITHPSENRWHLSALEAVQVAKEKWIRVRANKIIGAYDIIEAQDQLADPKWPEISMNDILRLAFKDRIIVSLDHPEIKRLKGVNCL